MIIDDQVFDDEYTYNQEIDNVVYIIPALVASKDFESKLQALVASCLDQQPGPHDSFVIRYKIDRDEEYEHCDGSSHAH